MTIKVYTVGELENLLEFELFQLSNSIPISPQRALSHTKNPRAEKNDKVLWCMFNQEQLIAYRLLLPDYLYSNNRKIKMAWLSGIWVEPNHRRKGYGIELTALALEAWENKLMGTNFAPASLKMYKNSEKLYPFKILEGIRLYYKANSSDLLINRNKGFKIIQPLLRVADKAVNSLRTNPKFHSLYKLGLSAQTLPELDDESFEFIDPFISEEYTRRLRQELNWALKFPWILEKDQKDRHAQKFHFSANAQRFEQLVHKIIFKGRLIAVLISSIIDGKFLIPYSYFQKTQTSLVAKYIENLALEYEAETLTLFDKNLVTYFQENRSKAIFSKSYIKRYMAYDGIPKEFSVPTNRFQAGDGDGVFT